MPKTKVKEKPETKPEEKKPEAKTKEGYVEYCLPFMPDTKMGDAITVTINGKNTQVQYGVTQMIPIGVRDVLEEMVKQQMVVAKKIEELADNNRLIATIK